MTTNFVRCVTRRSIAGRTARIGLDMAESIMDTLLETGMVLQITGRRRAAVRPPLLMSHVVATRLATGPTSSFSCVPG